MIYGIGTDIVAVERMARLLSRHSRRAADKILAPSELEDWAQHRDPARFMAKRWAAKEALGKALGTGIRAPVLLPAIAVKHDALGKPFFVFTTEMQRFMLARRLKPQLSLSDEAGYVLAFVIVECE